MGVLVSPILGVTGCNKKRSRTMSTTLSGLAASGLAAGAAGGQLW